MKSLIVNADDAGRSNEINEAVKKTYLAGAITGMSVMACGRCFGEAAVMLKEIGKSEVGVHLTLTGGFPPCTEPVSRIASLVDEKGMFPGSYWGFMGRYFRKKIKTGEIYIECANQIKKVKEENLVITHLDSHEHIHMFPGVLKTVVRLAKEFDIPYIRVPLEKTAAARKNFRVIDLLRHAGLKLFASGAKKIIAASGLKCNDAFLGHFHSGRITDDILVFMMENLEEGLTELALHPGTPSHGPLKDAFWYRNAPAELDILLNGAWRRKAGEKGIRLVEHSSIGTIEQ